MINIYISILVIILTLVINKINKYLFKIILKRRNKIHLKFMRSIITVIIYVTGVCIILSLFKVTHNLVGSLVTSSSIIVAVAIFAAQESLNDILSGVMLSWSRPFDIGERVQIVGLNITGIIEDITVRHTIIRTFNHAKVVVPNSVLNKQVIENNSSSDSRVGSFLDVIISYGSNLDKAISILEELVSAHELVLVTEETPIKVVIRELTENGIALRVQIWTEDVGKNFEACSDLRMSLLKKFKENDIEIPYKQVKVIK
jgi:small-conductance mechanosensitive channel